MSGDRHRASPRAPHGLRLFGRGPEQAALEQVITDARLGSSRVMLVSGEPGIGKTALLQAAAGVARSAGMEVLAARSMESEAELPFAGLLELLRPALEDVDRIPAAQAEALRSALDLGSTVERDPFVVGAATLNLLSARSERAPLLVVVDDAHWLDDSSLTALLFAARRLLMDPVAVTFAVRTARPRCSRQRDCPSCRWRGLTQRPPRGLSRNTRSRRSARDW